MGCSPHLLRHPRGLSATARGLRSRGEAALRTPRLILTPAFLKTLPTPNGPFWGKSCFPRP